ncbi:MAG: hypothetical protein K6V73_06435 [Firmicutes bacterium]|nr:hypothetical protein [Bacillota bacterium]
MARRWRAPAILLALAALGPARAARVEMAGGSLLVYGAPEDMPRLVGARGMNARLASALVGLLISVRRM